MNKFKICAFNLNIINEYKSDGISISLNDSDNMIKLNNIFKELTQKYCDIHNYKFLYKNIKSDDLSEILYNKQDYQILNNFKNNKNREIFENIVLYKIILIRDELLKNDSEYLALIDTDAIISNPNITLESLIDDGHSVFLSQGNPYDMPNIMNKFLNYFYTFINDKTILNEFFLNKKIGIDKLNEKINDNFLDILNSFYTLFYSFNEGFFIIKNTNLMKDFFTIISKSFYVSYLNQTNEGSDGFLIHLFLNNANFKDKMCYLPLNVQGHIYGSGLFKYDVDKTFIQHNYAIMNISDRLKYAELIKTNKWWKSINGGNL